MTQQEKKPEPAGGIVSCTFQVVSFSHITVDASQFLPGDPVQPL